MGSRRTRIKNASITTQVIKQKAKWAAIEGGHHNASITTYFEKKKKNRKQCGKEATKSKNNTRTTALERSVESTSGVGGGEGIKALLQLANFTLGPDATLSTEIHKHWVRIKLPTQSMHESENIKITLITIINKDEYS